MTSSGSATPPVIHRPGRPTDLLPAELLWARWAVLAALLTTAEREDTSDVHRTGFWVASGGGVDRLRFDDGGSSWWALRRAGEGRFVLYGEDESSQVKWHDGPIDVLAGAPDWLPLELLRDLISSYEIGCVYWYENGTWSRAPYPDDLGDDGLDCGMKRFTTFDRVGRELEPWLDDDTTDPDAEIDPVHLARLLGDAEAGTLTEDAVRDFVAGLGRPSDEIRLAVDAARRAGIAGERRSDRAS
ncbi:hypothetical protein ACFYVL_20760 [Streptomyces sp. NPDC004111]|uniref:hypothetical protein n=1 Tax=Streptomyces sp. NPDC004111 TaxID=3364690 RepID=UPI0036C7D57D